MALEIVSDIDDLVITNPTATDPVSEADDHMRNIKIAILKNLGGDASSTTLKVLDAAKVIANATGCDVVTAVDAAVSLRMLNSDTPDVGVALTMAILDGVLTLAETDGAGVAGNSWAQFTRAAGVELNFADVLKLATIVNGARVSGALLDLDNSGADAQTDWQSRNSIGGWKFGVNAGTGRMQIDQISSAGVFEVIQMTMERAGKCGLRFNGVEQFQTADGSAANSTARLKDGSATNRAVGFNVMPQVIPVGSFTVGEDECGTRQRSGNVGITVTLPNSALTTGWSMILQKGTVTGTAFDTITTPGTLRWYKGDEILTGNRQLRQSGVCTIAQNSTGVYDIWGIGLS